jgi:hypothetical protein
MEWRTARKRGCGWGRGEASTYRDPCESPWAALTGNLRVVEQSITGSKYSPLPRCGSKWWLSRGRPDEATGRGDMRGAAGACVSPRVNRHGYPAFLWAAPSPGRRASAPADGFGAGREGGATERVSGIGGWRASEVAGLLAALPHSRPAPRATGPIFSRGFLNLPKRGVRS